MKNSTIVIRVSDSEKEQIKQTAERHEMSISEYMLMIHRISEAKEREQR